MKTLKKHRGNKTNTLLIIIVLFALIGIAGIMLDTFKPTQTVTLLGPQIRTSSEIRSFWTREVSPTISSIVQVKSYAEVNTRFLCVGNIINKQTGLPLYVSLQEGYHPDSKLIEAAGGYDKNGRAEIVFFVSSVMDEFEIHQKNNQNGWQQAFKNHMIIIFMHELEHLNRPVNDKKIGLEEEARAWYDTCTHTIAPLIKKYNILITGDIYQIYQAWKNSSGPTDSRWTDAVKHLYRSVF